MTDKELLLDVINVEKRFGGLKALNKINLQIEPNTVTGLIGPNGSGKSTLFNVVSGLLPIDGGEIIFLNKPIHSSSPASINNMGLSRTFQDTRLFADLTVIENLCLPPKSQSGEKVSNLIFNDKLVKKGEAEVVEKAFRILKILEIEHMAYEYANSLSGGQKKLVDVGRVLLNDPSVILMDEPTAGVNPVLAKKLFDRIININKRLEISIIIIEHNMDLMMDPRIGNLYVAHLGEIIDQGPSEQNSKITKSDRCVSRRINTE